LSGIRSSLFRAASGCISSCGQQIIGSSQSIQQIFSVNNQSN